MKNFSTSQVGFFFSFFFLRNVWSLEFLFKMLVTRCAFVSLGKEAGTVHVIHPGEQNVKTQLWHEKSRRSLEPGVYF